MTETAVRERKVAPLNRESLKRRIVARYSTRVHMMCILAATCLVAMLSSAIMLSFGLHDMRWRYAVVVSLAYSTFLCGVWVWLRLAGFERSKESEGSSVLDAVNLPGSGSSSGGSWGGLGKGGGGVPRGGGGGFDGGGASASFAEGGGRMPAVAAGFSESAGESGGSEVGKALGGLGDIGGDDIGAIILLIVLALAIFLASGYLVWMAPEILTEAAFGAVLAGGLAKKAKQQSATGWVAGVMRKTWWPFAIVFVLAMVFAFYSKAHYPEAKTFREVINAAASS